jgi:hypothetical protein
MINPASPINFEINQFSKLSIDLPNNLCNETSFPESYNSLSPVQKNPNDFYSPPINPNNDSPNICLWWNCNNCSNNFFTPTIQNNSFVSQKFLTRNTDSNDLIDNDYKINKKKESRLGKEMSENNTEYINSRIINKTAELISNVVEVYSSAKKREEIYIKIVSIIENMTKICSLNVSFIAYMIWIMKKIECNLVSNDVYCSMDEDNICRYLYSCFTLANKFIMGTSYNLKYFADNYGLDAKILGENEWIVYGILNYDLLPKEEEEEYWNIKSKLIYVNYNF